MKDNFSTSSDSYAKYRPGYPGAFYDYLKTLVATTDNAWDCATGSGQAAGEIAGIFSNVFATDISQAQIDNAVKADNIYYSVQQAEHTTFPDNFFNLVIVGQAIHWFDFDKFYAEVKRVCSKNAILILIGYGRLVTDDKVTAVVDHLYKDIIGSYWDEERKYIDDNYTTLPFPFEEIALPVFENKYEWTLEQLTGYLNTWSAVKHYIKDKQTNPVDEIYPQLKESWGNAEKRIIDFPLLIKAGRVNTATSAL